MKVLHITPHLGGGVGKALSGVISQSAKSNSEFEHTVVCLEKPIDIQFINKILEYDKNVIIQPTINDLIKLMEEADIVQLEWWNHLKLPECLCNTNIPPIRLLVWCHKNGLYDPVIPKELILNSHMCLFTSQCSLEKQEIKDLIPTFNNKMGVVYSSGGFSDFPEPKYSIDTTNQEINENKNISVGYFGNMKFSKLHPDYINYLKEVKIQNFRVKMIGEKHNVDILNQQCKNIGKSNLLEFTGYVENPVNELKSINVLAYILNPKHFGTTENALLEAMSMGIVPVVLDNPAEKYIVKNNKTGLIVHTPSEFAEAIHYLHENSKERQEMGIQASEFVREYFSLESTEILLRCYYTHIINTEKRQINFSEIFNTN